jgi:outer membrane receptor protein involved in Fe transport
VDIDHAAAFRASMMEARGRDTIEGEFAMRRFAIGLMLLAWMFAPATSRAEAPEAVRQNISGAVKDALGRPLGGVRVALQTSAGKEASASTSDKEGRFEFKQVAPGVYAVVAEKKGFKTATAIVSVTGKPIKPIALALESQAALSMAVVAERLNRARNDLSPETGSSVYRFSQQAIQELPQGTNTEMSNVLLQAPGVVQDSFGALHIRGEHGEIQYRINGVELPEGISAGFSQTFSPRFARSISLLEGALPAQYGYHTAGVVQIQTKDGETENGGNIDMYGGQRATLNPSFELGGSKGNFSYYTTGYYLGNDRGLEPPTTGPKALHDHTDQGNGFAYLSYFLNPTTRVSFIGGFNLANFQIPANPGQSQAFTLAGVPTFNSANVRETQLEQNYYSVLALQGVVANNIDYQVAAFTRYSTLSFHPDQNGDLIFNGLASRVFRGDWASGLQGDSAYHGFAGHTIRAGFYFNGEHAEIDNHALVFPVDSSGMQTSSSPFAIVDNKAYTTWLYGVYLQDEWKPIERLTINFGARFDLYDGFTRSTQFSPRFAVLYSFPEGTDLHAAYARYFTPVPTEAVSGADLAKFKGTTGQGNNGSDTNISPERSHYFDVGVTQTFPFGLRVDLDSYYKQARDLIDEGQFGPTLIFTPFNYEFGRQYGVEFTTSLTRGQFAGYTNFAYSVAQGRNIVSDQFLFASDELAYIGSHYVFLDHDQTFSASAGAAYRVYGFLFSVDGIYGSGLRTGFANTGNLPYYIQVDAGITKTMTIPRFGPVEGRVAVVNLFDRTYQIRNGSGIGVFAAQYGPRLAFFGGLKIPFSWPRSGAGVQAAGTAPAGS